MPPVHRFAAPDLTRGALDAAREAMLVFAGGFPVAFNKKASELLDLLEYEPGVVAPMGFSWREPATGTAIPSNRAPEHCAAREEEYAERELLLVVGQISMHVRARVERIPGGAVLIVRESDGDAQAQMECARNQEIAGLVSDFSYQVHIDEAKNMKLVWVSETFKRVIGYTIEQLDAAGGLPTLVLQADALPLRKHLKAITRGQKHSTEFRVRCRTGETLWVRNTVAPIFDPHSGELTGALGAAREISEERLLNPLTGLPNVLALLDYLRTAVVRLSRHTDAQTAVLYLDFDHFHVYNQSLGFEGGDILLRHFADRLRDAAAGREFAAHLRGDEFAVVLTDYGEPEEAVRKANDIVRAVCVPATVGVAQLVPSISAGLAYAESFEQKAEDLLHCSQTAATRARALGGGRVEIYQAAMADRARKRLMLEGDLRTAIRNRSFPVHYQPIVNLDNYRLTGFEALVRLQHPQLGLLAPDRFVGIAEEAGLIIEIGDIVLQEACERLAEWRSLPGFSGLGVSVNLSAHQVAAGDLLTRVDRALRATGLEPDALRLELTESVAMRDPEGAISLFEAIRHRGCKLGLDDFGTGHSSLAWLRRFPVDSLKIDRSFVASMDHGGNDSGIVELIVALGHLLGLDVIAEGVERPSQASRLREMGCTRGQGYLFAPPLPAADVDALLARGAGFEVG